MILDTSAVMAILLREPEAATFATLVSEAQGVGIAGPTLAETGIVLGGRLGFTSALLHRFLQEAQVSVIPFGEPHWHTAVTAYNHYGKGRHAAGLNFGDCFSYATAKLTQQPLLCKGNDFTQTDLELVMY